ncbi:MAG: branched-chain amino acid aminotransferase [Eubacteriales bacterium]|nr:branched-chain amino acid aminotransferase [Eubacteriales bacterium]
MEQIRFIQAEHLKQKPTDESKLGFGQIFTDYMFTMRYDEEHGWHNPTIEPYHPLSMDPSTMVLHYGQSIFEGTKCYRRKDGGLQLFRPWDNFARMNRSAERLSIPKFDEELALQGLIQLIEVERDWVPHSHGASLYIRPTIIATDPRLGVHPSHTYLFFIILSPSGAYYKEGLAPVGIYVEDKYVRAVRGGIGFAKTAGNYAASLKASEIAEEKGYAQVLWLDGVDQKYVEEVGSMNMMFVVDGKLITPMLNGSILAGITRDSILKLAKSMGIETEERRISIQEIINAAHAGKLDEAFGTGTAAVVSPVGELCVDGEKIVVSNGKIGKLTQKLYDTLTGIQYGDLPDTMGWVRKVD